MLQLNPNEIIKNNKLIHNSLDIIEENINFLKKKDLLKLVTKIKNDTDFLNKIIDEIEKATGIQSDKLLKANYKNDFYEDKLLSYYAKMICENNEKNKKEINILQICYASDEKLSKYCQRQNFINHYELYLKGFNPNKFGMDKETVLNELIYIYDNRGPSEAYDIMQALAHNCPSNYFDYHFNPKKQTKKNAYYDYNKTNINNYQTNSEIINVNGYEYEFAQVLPKDCTNIELLAYNFCKANVINTMRTLPSKYLDLCSQGNSNTIILTSDKAAMNNNSNFSGYYKPSSLFNSNTNMIVIDAHGSFSNNDYYTQDTIIHEMGHKFDDMLYKKSFFDRLFGKTYYTTHNDEWEKAYNKYKNVVNAINSNGYEEFPNINEFFGDTMIAYFKTPNDLKNICPEVYNLVNEMLDNEYGYSYEENIVKVLNNKYV